MVLKHLPSGLSPYETCGFERSPYFPVEGTDCTILSRVTAPSRPEVYLSYQILLRSGQESDGIHLLKANFLKQDGEDLWYFGAVLSGLSFGETLVYHLTAELDGESVSTGDFSVNVCRRISAGHPSGFVYDNSRLLFRFEDFNTIAAGFDMHTGIPSFIITPAPECETCQSSLFQWENDSYSVTVDKKSCMTARRSGSELLTIDPSDFELTALTDASGRIYQVNYRIHMPGEVYMGFGEHYDCVNQAGKSPMSYVIEKFTHQKEKTYLPVPLFYTEKGAGLYHANSSKVQFELGKSIGITADCPQTGDYVLERLLSGTPQEMLNQYYALTGRPVLPPKWAFGPWMSANGWNTQKESLEQIDYMNEYHIPATVMVLEAWSDENTFYIWNGAEYRIESGEKAYGYGDFNFERSSYWNSPKEFCEQLKQNNVKLVLWQIPVIKYVPDNQDDSQLGKDWQTAVSRRYCVMNEDGTPYRLTEMWFKDSLLLDFSNPEAKKWWFDKRRYLVEELGVAGFKTDGGEFSYDVASRLADGRSIRDAHNDYPDLYIGAYHDFMKQCGAEPLTFSRAGYSRAHCYPIHWAGDQLSEFCELQSQLKAGLSAGLSGIPFWGFDIGGFAGDFPTKELYLRAAEMGAFCPVMQFHSEPRYGQFYYTKLNCDNNDRSPWNIAKVYGDPSILECYREYANLHMNLIPYLYDEAKFCVKAGRPMMAALVFDYYTDKTALSVWDEYMLGRSLLVAPITEENVFERTVYLPAGNWIDFWSGKPYRGGQTVTCPADVTQIPVFVKDGAVLPLNANRNRIVWSTDMDGAIGNDIDHYELLTFLIFGSSSADFDDEAGNSLHIQTDGDECILSGKLAEKEIAVVFMDGITRHFSGTLPVKARPREFTVHGRSCSALLITGE